MEFITVRRNNLGGNLPSLIIHIQIVSVARGTVHIAGSNFDSYGLPNGFPVASLQLMNICKCTDINSSRVKGAGVLSCIANGLARTSVFKLYRR